MNRTLNDSDSDVFMDEVDEDIDDDSVLDNVSIFGHGYNGLAI